MPNIVINYFSYLCSMFSAFRQTALGNEWSLCQVCHSSLSLPSLSSSKIEALWQQNKIWQRTDPGSAACGCLMPQVSLSLSLPTLFSIFYFFHFKVCSLPQLWSFARMCVTVKRSGTSSLRNCVRFLLAWFFPLQQLFHFSTFPQFSNFIRSFFLWPHQHLLSCGTRCLRSKLEGLSDGPDLIIGSSHQSFQSTSSISIKLKVRAQQHTQWKQKKEPKMAVKQKKSNHLPFLEAKGKQKTENKNKRNVFNLFAGNFLITGLGTRVVCL